MYIAKYIHTLIKLLLTYLFIHSFIITLNLYLYWVGCIRTSDVWNRPQFPMLHETENNTSEHRILKFTVSFNTSYVFLESANWECKVSKTEKKSILLCDGVSVCFLFLLFLFLPGSFLILSSLWKSVHARLDRSQHRPRSAYNAIQSIFTSSGRRELLTYTEREELLLKIDFNNRDTTIILAVLRRF